MIANLVFLRLRGDDVSRPVEVCVTDERGAIVFSGWQGLSECAPWAEGRRVIATLPGREALFLRAVLPPMPRRQIAKALPYAIEDRLVDELATLHLAYGTAESSAAGLVVPVEVIARERIETTCARLDAHGLRPSALYVDAAMLGSGPDACVWLDGEEVHLRNANGERTSLTRSAWDSWQRTGTTGDSATPVVPPSNDPMWLANRLFELGAINLLQGEFASRAASGHSGWRRWRSVAAVAAVVVLLQMTIILLAWHDAREQETSLDAQLVALARPVLPIGGDAVDALTLIREAVTGASPRVDELAKSPGLEVLGLLAQQQPPLELSAISGDMNLVEIAFARLESTEAQTLQRILRAAGWTVEVLPSADPVTRWRLTRTGAL